MTLVYSGAISLGAIADEFGAARSNVSLRSRSSAAGKGTPDAMSEFYGYTAPKAAFQHGTTVNGPNQTNSSGTLVTYKANVLITLKCFGGTSTGATAYATYWINGVGTAQTATAPQYGMQYASINVATAGSRSAALSIYPGPTGASSSQYADVVAS
jgi:hypothetical protein